jgi:hypothetical protein
MNKTLGVTSLKRNGIKIKKCKISTTMLDLHAVYDKLRLPVDFEYIRTFRDSLLSLDTGTVPR